MEFSNYSMFNSSRAINKDPALIMEQLLGPSGLPNFDLKLESLEPQCFTTTGSHSSANLEVVASGSKPLLFLASEAIYEKEDELEYVLFINCCVSKL